VTTVGSRTLAALGVAAALVSTAAGPARAADDAATVNDVSISVDEFEQLVVELGDAGLAQFVPDPSSSTLAADDGRNALSLMVLNEAHGQFFAGLGEAPPTAQERDEALAESVPEDHPIRDQPVALAVIGDDAVYSARLDTMEIPVSDTLDEQYEASPSSLGVYCASAIAVATEDEGVEVVRAVEDGATPDEAADVVGGSVSDWQCTPLATVADPVLLDSLVSAEPGDAVGPVSTSDGLVVLVVDDFEAAEPKLESFFLRLEEEGQTSAGVVLFQGFSLGADITINPRYGRWDATSGSVVALGT
jgi:hypothetical protein